MVGIYCRLIAQIAGKALPLLLVCYTSMCLAQENVQIVDSKYNDIYTGDKVNYLQDTTKILTISNILDSSYQIRFQKYERKIIELGFNQDAYWLKFNFYNIDTTKKVIISIEDPLYRNCMFYDEKGNIIENMSNNSSLSFAVLVNLPQKKFTEFYIRVTPNGMPLTIKMYSNSYFSQLQINKHLSFGIFVGLLVFIIFYNLISGITNLDTLHYIYAILVMCFLLFSISYSGYLSLYSPYSRFFSIFYGFLLLFVLSHYCILFLEIKLRVYRWWRFLTIFKYYNLGLCLIWGLLFRWEDALSMYASLLLQINSLIAYPIFAFLGWYCWRFKNSFSALYYMVAYIFVIFFIFLELAHINLGIKNIGCLRHTEYAFIFESIILSYAFNIKKARRYRKIRKEKALSQIAFNKQLRKNKALLNNQNKHLKREVAYQTEEFVLLNESLIRKNEELHEINEENNALIYIVAHDLRSPLNTVLGLILLMKNEFSEPAINVYLEMMQKAVSNNLLLIQELITLASLEQNLPKEILKPIQTKSFFGEIIKSYDTFAQQKNINFCWYFHNMPAMFSLDPNALRRILENLLSNAIKFSSPYSTVFCEVYKRDSRISIIVTDEGQGIQEKDKPRLFKKFQKLSASPTAGEYSSGLGLAIVKKLIDNMQGEINVHSEWGKGTVFMISFPTQSKQEIHNE